MAVEKTGLEQRGITTAKVRIPTDIHRLLLNVGANQATVALLAAKARDEERIADTLQRVGSAVAAEFDLEKVVQAVTDEATAHTGANFGAFFYNVVNPAGESYMLYTLAGAAREAFSRFPMPRNTAIFGPTFSGSAVVRLPDVTADPRFGHNPPYHGMPPGHLPVAVTSPFPSWHERAQCTVVCFSDTATSGRSPNGTSGSSSAWRRGRRSRWTTVPSTRKHSAPTWRRITSWRRCPTSCARL